MRNTQPDWNRIAEKFDLWLPHLAPVSQQLIRALDPGYGETILDVACGTGEPALTLARRVGDADITAVDAARGMVDVAKKKAEREQLSIHFDTMPAERLRFEDDRFDAVICRFGVMLFDHPVEGLKQIRRVLKPGGRYALAVWGELDRLSSFKLTADAIDPLMADDNKTPMARVTSLGIPGAMQAALTEAGFEQFEIVEHNLLYTFDHFDAWWNLIEASEILAAQLGALNPAQQAQVKGEIATQARAYESDGKLVMPHTYLVASGTK